MKSNPKTIAGVIVLVILAIALGFLLSRMIPTIGEVQREKSLTPTPLPEIPGLRIPRRRHRNRCSAQAPAGMTLKPCRDGCMTWATIPMKLTVSSGMRPGQQ